MLIYTCIVIINYLLVPKIENYFSKCSLLYHFLPLTYEDFNEVFVKYFSLFIYMYIAY